MNLLRLFTLLALTLTLSSCGKSYIDIANQHKSDFDALKKDLADAASAIPEKPLNIKLEQTFDPLPKFIKGDLAASNTLITPIEQLKDPNADIPREKGLDFYLNDVKNLLIWAKKDVKALEDFEDRLKAAFELRYIVIYEIVTYRPPSMVDAKTYDRGGVVMVAYVYDRQAKKIIFSLPVTAQAAEKVSFQYKKDTTSEMSAGLKHAQSTMWKAAREDLIKKLTEQTGGSFEPK